MQEAIPPTAIRLGTIEYEINDRPGYSWRTEDHYYLVPLPDSASGRAVIRITWDDNDGRWGWSMDARGSDFNSAKEAAVAMVMAMFADWNYSPKSGEWGYYGPFLEELKRSRSIR